VLSGRGGGADQPWWFPVAEPASGSATTRSRISRCFPLPKWEQVQTVASQNETRDDERLVLDTRRDLDACIQDVLDYLDRT
jgi:hypothetical protein